MSRKILTIAAVVALAASGGAFAQSGGGTSTAPSGGGSAALPADPCSLLSASDLQQVGVQQQVEHAEFGETRLAQAEAGPYEQLVLRAARIQSALR